MTRPLSGAEHANTGYTDHLRPPESLRVAAMLAPGVLLRATVLYSLAALSTGVRLNEYAGLVA